MQILIVTLLLSGAVLYLLKKWLPLSAKRWLLKRLDLHQTKLGPLLTANGGGCGSGCGGDSGGCGSCANGSLPEAPTSANVSSSRVIRIHPR